MFSTKPLRIQPFPTASGRGEVDQLLGISIERLTEQTSVRHIPHDDFYHLFWIESGSGTFVSDGRSYRLAGGSLIFVPRGQVHALKRNNTLKGYVLCLKPAELFSGNDWIYLLCTIWHGLARQSKIELLSKLPVQPISFFGSHLKNWPTNSLGTDTFVATWYVARSRSF